ncbi:HTH-type transcriptional repressor ComR [Paenibacillus auburnensis]|jgi:TetR/AcrR family transcriptional regulator, transcriptional repressor for nem operon|uniref:HTH-type transcriptional repressor ComR n=1 Tax=Paenibacillus auburnensis TaxID=2905649 RepID=A0ABM9BUD0_9BACL|nr:TetR/AcrR family transcriptional regulator [Paenibacillus auburnensis]CAH1194881.1 HTH-type transcriptional repressor ComR [Paenibacillus auburnensis]
MARSKEFDVDNVLRKAMMIFWQQGYEKTSMQDLVSGMGIHKRSMYDTFGDKHTLYMKVIDRYAEIFSSKMENRVEGLSSAKEAIRLLFEMAVLREEIEPKGCLLVNTAVELSNLDPDAAAKVNDAFLNTERLFERLLRHGQESGELKRSYEPADMAAYLHNVLVGLRVMVKTTQDRGKLQNIIDTALKVLD